MQKQEGFRFRNFISLLVALSGFIMIVSGLVNFVMPEGRVAYWNGWRLFGLDKGQWGAIHTILSLVFLFASTVHIYFNWRTLVIYLKDRVKKTFVLSRELAAALILSALCLHGSIFGYAPFTGIMSLGKTAKAAWYAGKDVHPPFPHAEFTPLMDLARKVDFNIHGALAYLREQGFATVTPESTLKQLTSGTDQSPAQVFESMMMDDRLYE